METLEEKVFAILGLQLGITWAVAVGLIRWLRRRHAEGVTWIRGGMNAAGQLDLELDWETSKPYCLLLCLSSLGLFLLLFFFGQADPRVGVSLFAVWSVLIGLELGMAMVAGDENIAPRILSLTVLVVLAMGVGGWVSRADTSLLGVVLFFSLLGLIALDLVRLFFTFYVWAERLVAIGAVAIFALYLYFDFNRLSRLREIPEANDWRVAFNLALNIYLDIINLFLSLLDWLA